MVPAPVLMMPFAPADVIPPKLTTLPAPKSNVFTALPKLMTLPAVVSLKLMNTPVPVVMLPRVPELVAESLPKV